MRKFIEKNRKVLFGLALVLAGVFVHQPQLIAIGAGQLGAATEEEVSQWKLN